ncbi:MAG: hypothetical protein ACXQS5_03900 [Candidatus Methanospirareceae archaeon]
MNTRFVVFAVIFIAIFFAASIYLHISSEKQQELVSRVENPNIEEEWQKKVNETFATTPESTSFFSTMKDAFKAAIDVATLRDAPLAIRIPVLAFVYSIIILLARELVSGIIGIIWGR